jgi:putative aldouronate transport system permease protein
MWFKKRNPNQLSPVANTVINIIFIIFASVCILPVLLVFAVSITAETSVITDGFRLFPREFSLRAYEIIFKEQSTVVRAYSVTLFTTITGMILCVITVCLYAYPLSRQTFKFRKFFMFFLFFTMLFSGGLVASYMVNVNVLGLRNNIWIMILPMSFNAFWVIVMRTFFKNQIPESLIESAKIDGAGEWYALIKVVLPLSLPGIATVALFSTIGIWNDFFMNMLYIRDTDLYNLQRMIQEILGTITMLREMMFTLGNAGIVIDMSDMPSQTFRMAMCIVTIGPIILAYPFFQKYFIRGLTIGAIKE